MLCPHPPAFNKTALSLSSFYLRMFGWLDLSTCSNQLEGTSPGKAVSDINVIIIIIVIIVIIVVIIVIIVFIIIVIIVVDILSSSYFIIIPYPPPVLLCHDQPVLGGLINRVQMQRPVPVRRKTIQ